MHELTCFNAHVLNNNSWQINSEYMAQHQNLRSNALCNLGQSYWENCILGEHFSKHCRCTNSFLPPPSTCNVVLSWRESLIPESLWEATLTWGVAYPMQWTWGVVHWSSGSVNHSIEMNSTRWLNSITFDHQVVWILYASSKNWKLNLQCTR